MWRAHDFYRRRAELYDQAFSWDVGEEVEWLIERLNPRRALEPACGGGRMLAGLARRGVEVAGVDLSEPLLELARQRLRACGIAEPLLRCADFEEFDLGARFDAALCPVSSFGYLPTFRAAQRHLDCMARHLVPGARYLVQLDLRSSESRCAGGSSPLAAWEREGPCGRLRTRWFPRGLDAERRIETQVTRFELLSGPDAGRVIEDEHEMRIWSFGEWSELVERSPFRLVGAWDGTRPERPALPPGRSLEERPLTWLELALG